MLSIKKQRFTTGVFAIAWPDHTLSFRILCHPVLINSTRAENNPQKLSGKFYSQSAGLWFGRPGFDSLTVHVTLVVIDHESFLRSFVLYLCSGMYRSYQFLAKVKATSTGKLLDNIPRDDAVVEMCFVKFNVACCRYPEEGIDTTTTYNPQTKIRLFIFKISELYNNYCFI
jgi:hypothetical protein